MNQSVAHVAHYRIKGWGQAKITGEVNQTAIWKWKDELIEAVEKTLIETGFVPK